MRSIVVAVFALFSLSFSASAQDATQMAAQQATQAAEQSMRDAQWANQQAAQASQQATDESVRAAQRISCCSASPAAPPRFSRKSGVYHHGLKVRLKDSTRGAVMYYTTDGWMPTPASRRYTGPIKVASTTMIRAIAVAPGHQHSSVTSAVYKIPGVPTPMVPAVATLEPGAPLHLIFASAVSSKGLQIGDSLPVALAQDLVMGGVVVAPKLTPVLATVMQVDGPGPDGAPGILTFAVHSITLRNGETVPLSGTETIDGRPHTKSANALAIIPWVGLSGIFIHGEQAYIPKGAAFTAYIQSMNPALSKNSAEPQPVLTR